MQEAKERKVAALDSRIDELRMELYNLRPPVKPFSRPFTFKYQDPKGRIRKATEIGVVELRLFGASERIEGRALEIGAEIKAARERLRELYRENPDKIIAQMGRKAANRCFDTRAEG